MNPTTSQSLTVPGQAQQSLQQALSQISGMAQQAPQDPSTQISNAVTQTANTQQPQNVQNVTNQLTQQSGIPALQGQQQNLGQIFQMYLADQNLGSKYASPQLATGNSPLYGNPTLQGGTIANTNVQDPYLSSPQALVSAILGGGNTQFGQGGFQGFNTPGQNTSAITAVPNAATSLINTLQSGINSQQGLVDTGVANYKTSYANVMDTLNTYLTQQSENAFSNSYASRNAVGGYAPGSPQAAGYTEGTILSSLGANATPTDVWNYLNAHQSDITQQLGQSTMNQLWAWQRDLNTKLGAKGSVVGGKIPKPGTNDNTVTPITSTTTGATSGWKVKMTNGQTITVTSGGGLSLGNVGKALMGDVSPLMGGGQSETVDQIISDAKSAGATPEEIIQALKSSGYTVN